MPMKEGGALAPLEVVETWLSLTVSDLDPCLARQECRKHQSKYLSGGNNRFTAMYNPGSGDCHPPAETASQAIDLIYSAQIKIVL